MTIQEALQPTDIKKKIQNLQSSTNKIKVDLNAIKKQWVPTAHKTFDDLARPKKVIKSPRYDKDGIAIPGQDEVTYQDVTRVGLALQKLIVKRAAAFAFGNPVKITVDQKSKDSELAKAVFSILDDVKITAFNRKMARTLFASTEVAECWYIVEKKGFKKYGFKSDARVKVKLFDPLKGDELFPFFDDNNDMAAFSRKYRVTNASNEEIEYFETWTDEKYTRYKAGKSGWTIEIDIPNPLGKIPIIYGSQETTEWNDVQNLIERLELSMSMHGDTNDYHASPKYFVKGNIVDWASRGEAGAVIEGDENTEIELLQWQQAPESVKLEQESLIRFIFSLTQTPDISAEALKGLGGSGASGNTFKMLFLDAHLKVADHNEVFDDYLERRLNLIKYIAKEMKATGEPDEVEMASTVIPYMMDDEKDLIANIGSAINYGILSKKTGIELNPLVDSVEDEMAQLKTEAEETLQNKVKEQKELGLDSQFN